MTHTHEAKESAVQVISQSYVAHDDQPAVPATSIKETCACGATRVRLIRGRGQPEMVADWVEMVK